MSEKEIIELFHQTVDIKVCPSCGSQLTGGYYNPEELIKGPSDGVVAARVPIEVVRENSDLVNNGLALYIECEKFGRGCRFRDLFFRFYKSIKRK